MSGFLIHRKAETGKKVCLERIHQPKSKEKIYHYENFTNTGNIIFK